MRHDWFVLSSFSFWLLAAVCAGYSWFMQTQPEEFEDLMLTTCTTLVCLDMHMAITKWHGRPSKTTNPKETP